MQADSLCSVSKGVPVDGPLLISPKVFHDDRGFFYESWNNQKFCQCLEAHNQKPVQFVQDNHSRSVKGVLRGLHYQIPPHSQAKLVRCVVGEIYDVAVDLRKGSTSYGDWVGAYLSHQNQNQLWIPEGFAHGFLVLSDQADVLYKTNEFWHPECERSLLWNDPTVAISWPLESMTLPLLSDKDSKAPLLNK